jgi:hypothetical protein
MNIQYLDAQAAYQTFKPYVHSLFSSNGNGVSISQAPSKSIDLLVSEIGPLRELNGRIETASILKTTRVILPRYALQVSLDPQERVPLLVYTNAHTFEGAVNDLAMFPLLHDFFTYVGVLKKGVGVQNYKDDIQTQFLQAVQSPEIMQLNNGWGFDEKERLTNGAPNIKMPNGVPRKGGHKYFYGK